MGRSFDITLSCSCAISLDGGGALISCEKDDCKYEEEYLGNPDFPMWEQEIQRRNGMSEKDIKEDYGDRYVEVEDE